MTTQLREAIARLRRKPPGKLVVVVAIDDLMLVCDALEASPGWESLWEESQLALVRCQRKLSTTLQMLEKKRPLAFDKVAYQREYMRKKRKRARMIRDSTRWLPPA